MSEKEEVDSFVSLWLLSLKVFLFFRHGEKLVTPRRSLTRFVYFEKSWGMTILYKVQSFRLPRYTSIVAALLGNPHPFRLIQFTKLLPDPSALLCSALSFLNRYYEEGPHESYRPEKFDIETKPNLPYMQREVVYLFERSDPVE